MILFWFTRKVVRPNPKLPASKRVSVLDEIVHSDWYKPKAKRHERDEHSHPQRPSTPDKS